MCDCGQVDPRTELERRVVPGLVGDELQVLVDAARKGHRCLARGDGVAADVLQRGHDLGPAHVRVLDA